MSLIWKPKIPAVFTKPKPKVKKYNFGSGHITDIKVKIVPREQMPWPESDLLFLIELRVLKCSYEECGEHLNRTANACTGAIQTNNLYEAIRKKRKQLLDEVLNEFKGKDTATEKAGLRQSRDSQLRSSN